MGGMINLGAGLSQMGTAVSDWASKMGDQQMKADLEKQQLVLSNRLLAEREHVARVETGEPQRVQALDLANVQQKLAIKAAYDYLDLPVPPELGGPSSGPAAVAPSAPDPGVAAPVPGEATAGAATTSAAADSGAGPASPGAPSPTGILSGTVAAPGSPPPGAGIYPGPKGKVTVATALPPSLRNNPKAARLLAMQDPGGFAKLVGDWMKPITVRQGESVMAANAEGGLSPIVTAPNLEKGQRVNAQGSVENIPGYIGALSDTKRAEAQATLPIEIQKITAQAKAQGDQSRETNKYTADYNAGLNTVAIKTDNGQDRLVTQADMAIAAKTGHFPHSTDATPQTAPGDRISIVGTVIPATPEASNREFGGPGMGVGVPMAQKANLEIGAKEIQKWTDNYQGQIYADQRVDAIARALKLTEGRWGAEASAEVSAIGKRFGIDVPDKYLNDPAQVQIIYKNALAANLEILKGFSSRPSQLEVLMNAKALPGADLQPQSNHAILAQQKGLSKYHQAFFNDWIDASHHGWTDPLEFESQWTAKNNLQGFIDRAYRRIGPLKGEKPEDMPPIRLPDGIPAGTQTISGPNGDMYLSPTTNQWTPIP